MNMFLIAAISGELLYSKFLQSTLFSIFSGVINAFLASFVIANVNGEYRSTKILSTIISIITVQSAQLFGAVKKS